MKDAGERYWRGFGKLESQSITEPRSGSDRVHHGYAQPRTKPVFLWVESWRNNPVATAPRFYHGYAQPRTKPVFLWVEWWRNNPVATAPRFCNWL